MLFVEPHHVLSFLAADKSIVSEVGHVVQRVRERSFGTELERE